MPPEGTTVAVPLEPPLQSTGVVLMVEVTAEGCVMVKDCVNVQPAGELMVQL